jgi:hypothetical protein
MSSPSEPAGTVPQRQLPTIYRFSAIAAAILLLAGGFVGALRAPGIVGLVGYGVSAVVAAAVGWSLNMATRRNRGYQSTHTTSLVAGLFVLVAIVNVLIIVVAFAMDQQARNVDLRFGVLLVTVLLALVIGAMGIFGVARGQRSREHIPPATPEQARARIARVDRLATAEHAMAEGEATPAQQADVIEDAARRADQHRQNSWARVRHEQRGS